MLYAKQIPPEYQESFFFDEVEFVNIYNAIAITGNRNFKEYFTETGKVFFDRLDEYSSRKYIDPEKVVEELKEKTGLDWNYKTIRGTCQSDWNYIFYIRNATTKAEIEELESLYFNTGAEYIIHDQETDPESPEDIEGYRVYIPETSETPTNPKEALAKALGTSPEEITLFLFDRWKRIPQYKEY